ncbi:MAG: hypothetical protein CMM16_01905 [Rhodospirillaceae bacterium]|nr:hypothetical protein [Rhodospirillaceae bacterium]
MTKQKKAHKSAGKVLYRAVFMALYAGATGMLAVGVLTKNNAVASNAGPDPAHYAEHSASTSDLRLVKAHTQLTTTGSGFGAGEAKIHRSVLVKPLDVKLSHTTGKLWELFRDIGYEIQGVRIHGEVPRLFLASLPQDLRYQQRVDFRKNTFIQSTLPLILQVNELILQDRRQVKSLSDQQAEGRLIGHREGLWLAELAERYGAKSADPAVLLEHVDIIPPSLAISQAAEESGWGTSRFAREGNALFGQRAYAPHKKGIVPKNRAKGESFRVRAFDHLIDGVKSYAHNLNSHPAYTDFREARAKMRAVPDDVDGYSLAGALTRYSERGADYVKTIRIIIRANTLQVFDDAKLGRSVAPDT